MGFSCLALVLFRFKKAVLSDASFFARLSGIRAPPLKEKLIDKRDFG